MERRRGEEEGEVEEGVDDADAAELVELRALEGKVIMQFVQAGPAPELNPVSCGIEREDLLGREIEFVGIGKVVAVSVAPRASLQSKDSSLFERVVLASHSLLPLRGCVLAPRWA